MSKHSKQLRRLRRKLKDIARCPECHWPAVPSVMGQGMFRCCNKECFTVTPFTIAELRNYSYSELEGAYAALADEPGFAEVVESMTRPNYQQTPVSRHPAQPAGYVTPGQPRSYSYGTPVGECADDHYPEDYGDYGPSTPVHLSDDDTFTCEDTDITDGRCPIKPPKVLVPRKMYRTWIALARENRTEWMAYLLGSFDEKEKVYVIRGMYFPPQTASGAHVSREDGASGYYRPRKGTIGAVHSHVSMGVFFSGCDEAHSNWPVEIVINDRGEYRANVRHKLDCGRWAKAHTKVKLTGSSFEDVQSSRLEAAFKDGEKLRQQRLAKSTRQLEVKPIPQLPVGEVAGELEKQPGLPMAGPQQLPLPTSLTLEEQMASVHADEPQDSTVISDPAPGEEELVITLEDAPATESKQAAAASTAARRVTSAPTFNCQVCNLPTPNCCPWHKDNGPLCSNCNCPKCAEERKEGVVKRLLRVGSKGLSRLW